MIKKFNFLVYPILTSIFLAIAWSTGWEDWNIVQHGTVTDAKVTALVRCYEDECDLIVDIAQELILTQADGTTYSAVANRKGILNEQEYTETQLKAINAVKGGKADGIQRFLQRENDGEKDDRIISVERLERVVIMKDLPGWPEALLLSQDRMLTAFTASGVSFTTSENDELVTKIVFTYIGGTDEADELKSDVREEPSRTLNGQVIDHDSKDFVLYETDFRYIFRPIFVYETEDGLRATLADIGARMSPRGGHHIGNEMQVAYLPDNPTKSTILSDFSQLKELDFIAAINRLFEITFGRWFFPAVSLLVALVYFIMSVISVPLMLKPPKTENADTVDEETLANMK